MFDEDYLLDGNSAKTLYDSVRDLPIFDYHSHLEAREIFEDRAYHDIGEIWLKYDHYKWRLMRAGGVDERYITGDATKLVENVA